LAPFAALLLFFLALVSLALAIGAYSSKGPRPKEKSLLAEH
jgi:hypothetical protein